MKNKEDLPDDKVSVKLSICNKCGGIVRTAVEHMMTRSSKNEFAKEVFDYDLTIKTISLLEYREEIKTAEWCMEDQTHLLQTRKVLIEKNDK
jgi:hypothetical protein